MNMTPRNTEIVFTNALCTQLGICVWSIGVPMDANSKCRNLRVYLAKRTTDKAVLLCFAYFEGI